MNVCILDYGSGNVRSVYNLMLQLTRDVLVSNEPGAIMNATHLILPGVGAFGVSKEKIRVRLPWNALTRRCSKRGLVSWVFRTTGWTRWHCWTLYRR